MIKFDEEGYRTDFSAELIQLFENGFVVTGAWNTSTRLKMLPHPPEAVPMDDSQLLNRTFVVITALVYLENIKNFYVSDAHLFRQLLMAC